MKMIVGLGNPGSEYRGTRHNAGFDAIDKVAESLNFSFQDTRMKAVVAKGMAQGEKVLLVKPQTYMNLSGEAVMQITQYYKINTEDLLIIYDDLDLSIGQIRLRKKGSSGGQKGMKNICKLLNTEEIARIRIGIGKDEMIPVVDYVLGKVKKEDRKEYEKSLDQASQAAIYFIQHTMEETMSSFNKKI